MGRFLLVLWVALWPLGAGAQSWPVHETTYVNDYAEVIEAGAEARITAALKALREETGIEATVLTLHSRRGFGAGMSLEEFATGLFNHWGIGNAETNDGILIYVAREDREMRIELGAGYGRAFNRAAEAIIEGTFLPAFRAEAYSDGIEAGTEAVIEEIARVHYAGGTPQAGAEDALGGGMAALLALVTGLALFRRRISDRMRRCPSCGKRGVKTGRQVLVAASTTETGTGEAVLDCPHCGYHHVAPYTISRVSRDSGSGSSFGGGSSSGGGASGKW